MGENSSEITSVEVLGPELSSGSLQGVNVAPLHGRQSTELKDATMRAFTAH